MKLVRNHRRHPRVSRSFDVQHCHVRHLDRLGLLPCCKVLDRVDRKLKPSRSIFKTNFVSQLLSVAMKPAQCTNDNVYIQYTQTTSWLWRSYDCKYTPMLRALEAFCWLSFISLLATIPLAIKDMQKRRQADINAKSGIPGYPALTQSADRVDRKPKVEEVVEVV